MKSTLLAINNISPKKKSFAYALQFCHVMMTDLLILQIIDPKIYSNLFTILKYKANLVHNYFEKAMAASALAESYNQELVLNFLHRGKENIDQCIPNDFRENVQFSLQQRIGDAHKEIIKFLDKRNDISIAVYDGPQISTNKKHLLTDEAILQQEIPFRIGIPFIKLADISS